MMASSEANNGAAAAESSDTGNIVSASAAAAAAASVAAASAAAASVVPVAAFGWSPTRPHAQAPPGKVTGCSGLAWQSEDGKNISCSESCHISCSERR